MSKKTFNLVSGILTAVGTASVAVVEYLAPQMEGAIVSAITGLISATIIALGNFVKE